MPFIDWSDAEGMLDLLSEFVRDEINESSRDPKRRKFLSDLLVQINELGRLDSNKDAVIRLRILHTSIAQEFVDDPVSLHIVDCIEELKSLEE